MSSTEGGWVSGCPEVSERDTEVAVDAGVAADRRTEADKLWREFGAVERGADMMPRVWSGTNLRTRHQELKRN